MRSVYLVDESRARKYARSYLEDEIERLQDELHANQEQDERTELLLDVAKSRKKSEQSISLGKSRHRNKTLNVRLKKSYERIQSWIKRLIR